MEKKKSAREIQIEYLMDNYYNTDDPKYYDSNLKYLESLTNTELKKLYESKM